MTGLIIKDLLNLRKNAVMLVIFVGLFFVFGAITQSGITFGTVAATMFTLQVLTAMSFDERAGWEKYALTMPVSRKDLVVSKYVLGILLSLVGFVINVVFFLGFSGMTMTEGLLSSLALLGVSCYFIALNLPPTFKWGVERGRLVMFVIMLTPAILIPILAMGSLPTLTTEQLEQLAIGLPLLMVVLLLPSLWLSLRIYSNKEF